MNIDQLKELQNKSTSTFCAKIIADSVNECGNRLTTFELTYPRAIHCFSDDTEFLSKVADEFPIFRTFDAIVSLGAYIAQYDPDGTISFAEPLEAIDSEANALLICENKLFPLAVTPEHRMFSYKRTTGNEYVSHTDTADDWTGGGPIGNRRIPKAGTLVDNERSDNISPEESALIAFFVADGSLVKNRAVFHFTKERKVQSVVSLLKSLEIDFILSRYADSVTIRFDAPWWACECYTEKGGKKYPDRIWKLNEASYSAFYEATLDSDGCRANLEINTFSPECAEQLQVVSLFNNKAMNIRRYRGGLYKQSYLASPYISFRKDKSHLIRKEGRRRVVCFSVPSTYLVVRRLGAVFISGNCEIMTHRIFSRNAASSRAIPVEKTIEAIRTNPFIPFHWGKNQSGMQAYLVLNEEEEVLCREDWIKAGQAALDAAHRMSRAGLHKQIANRILEPWMFITVVLSTTSFRHFELLRNHEAAEPHFQYLAKLMVKAREESKPSLLQSGQWHLPYIYEEDIKSLSIDKLKMVSTSRCAAVSYVRQNERKEYEKDYALHDRLKNNGHSSPFEHVATPYMEIITEGGGLLGEIDYYTPKQSGNFLGWKQYRKEIANEFVADNSYLEI